MINSSLYLVPFIFLIVYVLSSLTIGVPLLKTKFPMNVNSFLDKINSEFNLFNIGKEQLKTLHLAGRLRLLKYCIISFTIATIIQSLLGFIVNFSEYRNNNIVLFGCVIVQILSGLSIINISVKKATYRR